MKTILKNKPYVLLILVLFFSCNKEIEEQVLPEVEAKEESDLASAFAYATNLDGSLKSTSGIETNPDTVESKMLDYLSEEYGDALRTDYANDKDEYTLDLSSYMAMLDDISFNDLDSLNAADFMDNVFDQNDAVLKSASAIYSVSQNLQIQLDKLTNNMETVLKDFAITSIETNTFDKEQVKRDLEKTVSDFKVQVDYSTLTESEELALTDAILTIESSIGMYIEVALQESETDIMLHGLKSTNGWLKNVVKNVVKAAVTVVVFTVATVGGVVVGGIICGPYCGIVGGLGGAVGAFYTVGHLNRQIDKW